MTVEQFVMAYGAEQDRLRALLPEGFASLRPVPVSYTHLTLPTIA